MSDNGIAQRIDDALAAASAVNAIKSAAMKNAGTCLVHVAAAALRRGGNRVGLASTPADFTDEDVRQVWREIHRIGEAIRDGNCAI